MKLVYHKDPAGNFGDDLNPWLWGELLGPEFFDGDERLLFYGVGTLLSPRTVRRPGKKIVFGSGAASRARIRLDCSFDVRCVRGPLTAKALGLREEFAVTDPACLVADTSVGRRDAPKEYAVSVIPHHLSVGMLDWDDVSARCGMRWIDPRSPFLRVFEEIRRSRLVLTESLHGAVVADAFRVPWIPIRYSHRFLEFKWRDWAESLGIDLAIAELPAAFTGALSPAARAKNLFRRALGTLAANRAWSRRPCRRSTADEVAAFARALSRVAREVAPRLSSDAALERALGRLRDKLDELRVRRDGPRPV
ncbi:MAG: polysaccharide pyruvyl transferase family protein [Planctomycetota bacterium]